MAPCTMATVRSGPLGMVHSTRCSASPSVHGSTSTTSASARTGPRPRHSTSNAPAPANSTRPEQVHAAQRRKTGERSCRSASSPAPAMESRTGTSRATTPPAPRRPAPTAGGPPRWWLQPAAGHVAQQRQVRRHDQHQRRHHRQRHPQRRLPNPWMEMYSHQVPGGEQPGAEEETDAGALARGARPAPLAHQHRGRHDGEPPLAVRRERQREQRPGQPARSGAATSVARRESPLQPLWSEAVTASGGTDSPAW